MVDFSVFFPSFESGEDFAIINWLEVPGIPENDAHIGEMFLIKTESEVGGANKLLFGIFGMTPGAGAKELLGDFRGDSNHGEPSGVVVIVK